VPAAYAPGAIQAASFHSREEVSGRCRLEQEASRSYHRIPMRAVGLKVLKNKLSEYVRLARGGETILVTDRDRVVAELVPPREGRSPAVADALLAELMRAGWVTPAARPLTGAPPRAPVATFEQLMRELDEDRADR
jgi:antitoxin (DNA-binding transcriptional repressor) of toxin-antitoxin stability system